MQSISARALRHACDF